MRRAHGLGSLLLAGIAAVTLGALASSAVAAAPSASISDVQTANGHLKLLFVAHDLPPEVGITPSKVVLTIGGKPVVSTTSTAAESHLARSAVLVIDTSGSMAGSGLDGAKTAATRLVQALPADVQVGLVAFSDRATVVSALTADRQRVLQAIASLQATGNTALYDGVLAGMKVLGADGQRRIIVLSDGADTSSKATLADVTGQLTQSHVAVDAVGFRTPESQQSTLGSLTAATGGVLYAANDAAAVAAAFSSVARSFVTQVYLDATIPTELAGQTVTVAISAETDAGAITAETTIDLPALAVATTAASSPPSPAAPSAEPAVTTAPGRHHSATLTRDIGLGSLFVAFAIVALLAIDGRFTRRRRELADVVGDYAAAFGAPTPTLDAADARQARSAQLALQMTDRFLKAHGWGERLALRLERAGLSIRANEWLVLQIVVSVSLTAVFVLLGANIVVAVVVCVVASEIVMRLWLGHRIERRRAAFLRELPDALQVLAGSISTGYSLDQAIDALLNDAEEPIAGEFGRAASEARLGVPLDNALAESARRVQLEEFDWAVMAIQVQRTVGGSLAEVLRNVASTIRQREKLRRQARVLSAEGRISAYILVALPLLMAAFFLLFKPAYFRPMYTSPGGVMALFVGAVLLILGWAWMSKLAKVEV